MFLLQEIAVQLPRRRVLQLTAATVAVLPRAAFGQTYPSRPARIIVGFPAGTSSDITARLIGQWLSERLNQQFIVEDRPGAGTNIAADTVVHAAPDGYTLLWVTQTNAINASIYTNLNFNFIRDIAPVASVIRVPAVVMLHPSVPAKTIPEFIAYAKAHPGKINMSTPGIGSINHIAGELFKMMAGVDLVAVHYRSSQFPDLLAGQVQVTFNPLPSSLEFIKSGKLRALAVTSTTRQAVLPDVPPVAQFLPGYEATAWFGIGAPKATPADIVDTLNREIDAGLADAKLKARLHDLGGEEFSGSPDDFAKFIAAETQKWAKVVKFAGIKPE
jgi:tripartite-type tricarboxylate transporter receptor subunit TctC